MNDESLLTGLRAAHASERSPDPLTARLERFAEGRLGEDERAELEGRLAHDEPGRERLARHAPLGSKAQARIVDACLDALGEPKADTKVVALEARRSSRARLSALLALPLAAAAAFLLVPRGGDSLALPAYHSELVTEVRTERGPSNEKPASSVHVVGNGRFELRVRPTVPVAAALEARWLVQRDDHFVSASKAHLELGSEGAVRVTGTADEVFPEGPGTYEIAVVVGPKGAVEQLAAAEAASGHLEPRFARVNLRVVRK
jgi:hypothetical protein